MKVGNIINYVVLLLSARFLHVRVPVLLEHVQVSLGTNKSGTIIVYTASTGTNVSR